MKGSEHGRDMVGLRFVNHPSWEGSKTRQGDQRGAAFDVPVRELEPGPA